MSKPWAEIEGTGDPKDLSCLSSRKMASTAEQSKCLWEKWAEISSKGNLCYHSFWTSSITVASITGDPMSDTNSGTYEHRVLTVA